MDYKNLIHAHQLKIKKDRRWDKGNLNLTIV
jgi:hypothetical protein